jgi:hypothetical protein
MHFRVNVLAVLTVLVSLSLPLQAQESETQQPEAQEPRVDAPLPAFPSNCEALPLVGGEGSEVTKEISLPGVNIPLPGPVSAGTRNNWHTDWVIPDADAYKNYMVILMPHTNREYDVAMYLKYPDDTNQRFYREQRTDLPANQPITVEVTPERSDLMPYQVNTNIGGIQAVGARYTVAVAGCR